MNESIGQKLKDLTCLMCHKIPMHEDIFIAKVNDNLGIVASFCLGCADGDTRPEKEGGWIIVQRRFHEFYAQDDTGEFANALVYNP